MLFPAIMDKMPTSVFSASTLALTPADLHVDYLQTLSIGSERALLLPRIALRKGQRKICMQVVCNQIPTKAFQSSHLMQPWPVVCATKRHKLSLIYKRSNPTICQSYPCFANRT